MHRLSKILPPALVFALAVPLLPQQVQRPDEDTVFRADTRLVVLHASVVDRRGNLVTGLPRSAFKVFEDGVEQQIRTFRQEDVPVSIGLLVDNSGSMRDKRGRVESAAMAAVKASNPDDEVFVVNFNDDAYLDVEMTSDVSKMAQGLARIDSRGGTAMRDAINLSVDYVLDKGKKDKKILLVITDGNDNTSTISLERLVQKAQKSEVIIYALALLNEEDRREAKRAKRALDALTDATGGQSYYPDSLSEVEQMALQAAHDIRNQYILGYSPTNLAMDGTYRRIRVTAEGRGRMEVRTRSGYYARSADAVSSTSGLDPAAARAALAPAQ